MESQLTPERLTQPTAREQLIQRRLEEFEHAILGFAAGNFDAVPEMTGEDEMLDAIAGGMAMLGEELRATKVSKHYLTDVLDAIPDLLVVLEVDGTIFQINRSVRETLDFEQGELLGRMAGELFASEVPSVVPSKLARLRDTGPISNVSAKLATKHGEEVPVRLSLSVMPQFYESERKTRIVLVARDVTAENRTQKELVHVNQDLERLVSTLEHRTREMDVISEMGEVLQSCHIAEEAFSVLGSFLPKVFPSNRGSVCMTTPSGTLLEAGVTWNDFPDDMRQRVFTPDQCWALRRGRLHHTTMAAAGSAVRCQHVDPAFEGSYGCIPMMAQSEEIGVLHLRSIDPSDDFDGAKMRVAHTIAEHIALALANISLRESLRQKSVRDPLTGLFNRRYLEETMERELHRANRAEATIGMIMLDIDHFKDFNDTHGHDAGDSALREVARVLLGHTRGEDIACRIGGEEFAVVLPDASLEETYQRADTLRKEVFALTLDFNEKEIAPVTISAGVAAAPEHGEDLKTLMKAADRALYRAKSEGRDRVVRASDDT